MGHRAAVHVVHKGRFFTHVDKGGLGRLLLILEDLLDDVADGGIEEMRSVAPSFPVSELAAAYEDHQWCENQYVLDEDDRLVLVTGEEHERWMFWRLSRLHPLWRIVHLADPSMLAERALVARYGGALPQPGSDGEEEVREGFPIGAARSRGSLISVRWPDGRLVWWWGEEEECEQVLNLAPHDFFSRVVALEERTRIRSRWSTVKRNAACGDAVADRADESREDFFKEQGLHFEVGERRVLLRSAWYFEFEDIHPKWREWSIETWGDRVEEHLALIDRGDLARELSLVGDLGDEDAKLVPDLDEFTRLTEEKGWEPRPWLLRVDGTLCPPDEEAVESLPRPTSVEQLGVLAERPSSREDTSCEPLSQNGTDLHSAHPLADIVGRGGAPEGPSWSGSPVDEWAEEDRFLADPLAHEGMQWREDSDDTAEERMEPAAHPMLGAPVFASPPSFPLLTVHLLEGGNRSVWRSGFLGSDEMLWAFLAVHEDGMKRDNRLMRSLRHLGTWWMSDPGADFSFDTSYALIVLVEARTVLWTGPELFTVASALVERMHPGWSHVFVPRRDLLPIAARHPSRGSMEVRSLLAEPPCGEGGECLFSIRDARGRLLTHVVGYDVEFAKLPMTSPAEFDVLVRNGQWWEEMATRVGRYVDGPLRTRIASAMEVGRHGAPVRAGVHVDVLTHTLSWWSATTTPWLDRLDRSCWKGWRITPWEDHAFHRAILADRWELCLREPVAEITGALECLFTYSRYRPDTTEARGLVKAFSALLDEVETTGRLPSSARLNEDGTVLPPSRSPMLSTSELGTSSGM